MTELRLKSKETVEEENREMNAFLLDPGQPPGLPVPAANVGQPVPPGTGPEPQEDENAIMNRRLTELAGIVDPNSR